MRAHVWRFGGAVAALCAALVAQAQPIGLGSSPQGTFTYQLAATVAKEITDTLKLQARVQPSGGTGAMVPLVNSGELDFGFCNSLELYESFHGVGTFDKRPNPKLRTVAVLFPFVTGIFVRADSPIKAIADLKGRSISYGFQSQEIIRVTIDAMLATAGLAPKDVRTVLVPNLIRGADEFMAGRVEATPFTPGAAKVSESDAAVGGIHWLRLGTGPEAEAALKKVFRTGYITTLNPAPGIVGLKEPTPMMAFDFTIFTNADVPPEKVKSILGMIVDRKDAMAQTTANFRRLSPQRLHIDYEVPYHPGAIAYFSEKGIKSAKQ